MSRREGGLITNGELGKALGIVVTVERLVGLGLQPAERAQNGAVLWRAADLPAIAGALAAEILARAGAPVAVSPPAEAGYESALAGPVFTAGRRPSDKPVTAAPPAVSVDLGGGGSHRLAARGAP